MSGNTSNNSFTQKGANQLTEYRGFNITRSTGRRGFVITSKAGPVPKGFGGQWLRLEGAKDVINAYVDDPVRIAEREKEAERSARAKAGSPAQSKQGAGKQEKVENGTSDSE